MAKPVTEKDVLYAMEYLGDALERASIRDGRHKWQMKNSGLSVGDRVADAVRMNPMVYPIDNFSNQIFRLKP